jgi:hypothetical protein
MFESEGFEPIPSDIPEASVDPEQGESLEGRDALIEKLLATHETQLQGPVPVFAQRCGCGIASWETTLRSRGLLTEDHAKFTLDYMTSARFSIPAVGVEIEYENQKYVIPVTYSATKSYEEVVQDARDYLTFLGEDPDQLTFVRLDHPDQIGRPAFTIKMGFDHRSIQAYITEHQLPLKAELTQAPAEEIHDVLVTAFESPEKPTILLSVNLSLLGYPVGEDRSAHEGTHVIAIHDIYTVNDQLMVLYTDPAFVSPTDGVQMRSLDQLVECYGGRATIISPIPEETTAIAQS